MTAAAIMTELFGAIGRRDLDALSVAWTATTVDRFHALGIDVTGVEALRAFFAGLFAAVPDIGMRLEHVHAVDDDVAVGQWHLTGTFTGAPFQGIEATGRAIDIHGIDVMRFDGGMLVRNDVYYDGLTFARQVGLLPAAGSVTDTVMLTAFNGITRVRRVVR